MSILWACKRLILLSRPGLWLLVAAIYAGGVVHAGAQWDWAALIGLFFCTIPAGIVLYGVNDIVDREADALSDRKLNGIMGVRVTPADTGLFLWAAVVVTIVFTAIFALTAHYWSAIGVLVVAVVSITYSVPPLRFKVRPVLDALDHVLGTFTVFLMGYFAHVTGFAVRWPDVLVLTVLACLMMAVYGVAALLDYDTDKKVGDRTLAVFLGKRATLAWSMVLFGVCAVLMWPQDHIVSAYFAFCGVLVAAALPVPAARINSVIRRFTIFGLITMPLTAAYILVFGY